MRVRVMESEVCLVMLRRYAEPSVQVIDPSEFGCAPDAASLAGAGDALLAPFARALRVPGSNSRCAVVERRGTLPSDGRWSPLIEEAWVMAHGSYVPRRGLMVRRRPVDIPADGYVWNARMQELIPLAHPDAAQALVWSLYTGPPSMVPEGWRHLCGSWAFDPLRWVGGPDGLDADPLI